MNRDERNEENGHLSSEPTAIRKPLSVKSLSAVISFLLEYCPCNLPSGWISSSFRDARLIDGIWDIVCHKVLNKHFRNLSRDQIVAEDDPSFQGLTSTPREADGSVEVRSGYVGYITRHYNVPGAGSQYVERIFYWSLFASDARKF